MKDNMKFPVKDTLTEEEIQKGLRSVIKDGLTTQMRITLTEVSSWSLLR